MTIRNLKGQPFNVNMIAAERAEVLSLFVTLENIIALLVAFQSLVFASFLWCHKSQIQVSRKLLAALMLSIGLHFLNIFLIGVNLVQLNLSSCFASLYAPIVYFYVLSVVDPTRVASARILLHGLPLIICVIWTVDDYRTKLSGLPPNSWITPVILVQISAYVVASVRVMRRYRTIFLQTQSSIGAVRQRMIVFLLSMFAALVVTVSLEFILSELEIYLIQDEVVALIFMIMLITVNGFLWFAFAHPFVFQSFEEDQLRVVDDNQDKYQSSTLTAKDADHYLSSLESLMRDERPYLDPNLKLQDLADRLNIAMRHLSQVINQRLGMNFFDYVNAYRVNCVKELMESEDHAHQTVMDLMLSAGFNTKSTFNKAFKKVTDTTPSQYRQTKKPK